MVENLEKYVSAWKNRLEDKERETKKRLEQAKNSAQTCANMLIEDYGVNKVYLVGSIQNPDRFHKKSDVDLAVSGLNPEDYYESLSRCWDKVPSGMTVDLISLEELSEDARSSLLENGKELKNE